MTHSEQLNADIKALNEAKEAIELEIFNLNIKRKFNLKNIKLKEEELAAITDSKPTATEVVGMINKAVKPEIVRGDDESAESYMERVKAAR